MREQLIQYVSLLFAGTQDCEDIRQEILQNTLDRYDDLITQGKVPEVAYRLAITGIGDINEILGSRPQNMEEPRHSPAPAALPADNDTPVRKLLRAIAVGLYILCPLPLILLAETGLDVLGLCGTLSIIAVATVLILLGSKKKSSDGDGDYAETKEATPPKSELQKSVSSLLWSLGIAAYFLISFATHFWHITWVLFPILGAMDQLLGTILLNREATQPQLPSWQKRYKRVSGIIWAIGLSVYIFISIASMAWYITWLIFPVTGAVQGLVRAILDYKEAVTHET